MSKKNIEDVYPLSPMQEGLLFHSLYAPEGGLYVTQIPYNCKGINASALRQAWQRIIDRHSIFRTAFVWKNIDKPMQVVGRQAELPFKIEDWRHLPATEQESRFAAYLAADLKQGFQLNKAPLLRIALFQTGDETYKFLLSHHHILMDGWSTQLIFKEVFALYEAFCKGQEAELEPAKPFKNYIAWLQQQDMAAAETFWREHLKGFTAPTPLVMDRITGLNLSSEERYAEEFVVLPAATTSALQALARQHQLTMNTVLQGQWALLLSKYSGERDVAFGTVVAGRPAALAGVESMVGLFINNLMTRIRISPEMPVVKWLKEVQEQQVEVRQYEHSPLSLVQTWSEVPGGERLFDSMISFQNFPLSTSLGRASQEIESIHTMETSGYPLTLSAEVGEELSVAIKYDLRFFDTPAAARIGGHLQTLLESFVANPQQTLARLSLLTFAERDLLLTQWNHSPSLYASSNLCIHELFEEQARLTPHAVAIVSGQEQVSYAELNVRANRLAHYLRSLGVGPEITVGLCLERSPEMVVALLGILKAGGAYVPLDPQYPRERLAFMLEDARVRVLITEQGLVEAEAGYEGVVVCLEAEAEYIKAQDERNPESQTTGDNLAYVIYTSGSTGQPKGVMITHHGLANYLKWSSRAYPLTHGHGSLLHSPLSFDLTVTSLWTPLVSGQSVHLLQAEDGLQALGAALCNSNHYSLVKLTPSHLEALAHLLPAHSAALSTHSFIIGGEALRAETLGFWREHAPATRLINEYGPTETVVGCCVYEVEQSSAGSGAVPIGRAIDNTQLYVLDEELELVPVGVAGELYIGGAGVARGYVGQAGLTARRFIPDQFSPRAGARLYRTGDKVRYRPDGQLEFMGRVDNQVKIRGHRVETGEIEAILIQHERVSEAMVIALDDNEATGKQLVAYIVAAQGESLTPGELRDHIKERLPSYMLPAAFVLLEQFPLTHNGKIDLKALPLPGEVSLEPEQTYVAPRNSVEEMVVGIWSQLLGVKRVGVNDNFFALGGNSIFAIQLMSRLNKSFHLDLQLRLIYDNPTPEALATTIVQAQAEQADAAELNRLLAELEELSEDEARSMLAEKTVQM
jgi:amino acid adenylation domain-containing protein